MMELRKASRFLLSCPTEYRWISAEGISHTGVGATENLGVGGVFVRGDRCPPAGTPIELDIALPSCEATGFGMRLCGVGQVLRVELGRGGIGCGFAASVHLDTAGASVENLDEIRLEHPMLM